MSQIHQACRSGDLKTVRELLSDQPDLVNTDDEHQWRPVFHAALRKHIEVVRFLISAGADLAAHNGYVLHYAAEVPDNQAVVDLLIQYGALEAHVRPQDDTSRQFLAAVFLNDVNRVSAFIRLYPDVALRPDGTGDLAIHHAARSGATEIVRKLVYAGAPINAATLRGHTVLYCAAGHGHFGIVQFLLENDVDVEAKFTKDGKTVPEWLDQHLDQPNLARVRALFD